MLSVTDDIDRLELRRQAHYWRALHARAVQREAEGEAHVEQLQATIDQLQAQIRQKDQQIEALQAKVAQLARQVFGRSTERINDSGQDPTEADSDDASGDPTSQPSADRRQRGQQRGAKGHGRKRHVNLACVEQIHELPEVERRCPQCGKPFRDFPGTEDSEQIEWEVIVRRRVHKRRRYQPTCDCQAVPGIVTAPAPAKLIPKGMFAISFWVRLLLEKFLFQRPLCRILKVLSLEGLNISAGTLTGGLQRLGELLQPIYTRFLERSRAANRWKMDETRWMVFEEVDGKVGHRWWLWVIITDQTVVYLLEPTRSATVPNRSCAVRQGQRPWQSLRADSHGRFGTTPAPLIHSGSPRRWGRFTPKRLRMIRWRASGPGHSFTSSPSCTCAQLDSSSSCAS